MIYSKTAKGLVSLITIVVLLSSVLAGSLFYGNNITGNVVQESSSSKLIEYSVREVQDISELKYLNEGWYEIRNGYVFYLESFDSYVPLNLKVMGPSGLNGLAVVDSDGKIEFIYYDKKPAEIKYNEENPKEQRESQNLITGEVTGLEGISGMQAAANRCTQHTLYSADPSKPDDRSKIWEWTELSTDCTYTSLGSISGDGQLPGRVMVATYSGGKLSFASATPPTTPPGGSASEWDFNDLTYRDKYKLNEFTQIYTVQTYTLAERLNVHPANVNAAVANSWYANKRNYEIQNGNLVRRENLANNLVKVTTINPSSGSSSFEVIDSTQTSSGQAAIATTTEAIRILNTPISAEDAGLILGRNVASVSGLNANDLSSIGVAIRQNNFRRENGVTVYQSGTQTRYSIPGGRNADIGGVRFTTPQGTSLQITHLGGNQYELGGVQYVFNDKDKKLYSISQNDDGTWKQVDPASPSQVRTARLGYNPRTLVRTAQGTSPAEKVEKAGNILSITNVDGSKTDFSTKGMSDAEIQALQNAISFAVQIDSDTNLQKGEVSATGNEIVIKSGDTAITYTRNSIVVTQDGKKTKEITYQTGLNNARINIEKNYDSNEKLTVLKINGANIDSTLVPVDFDNKIDWSKYDPKMPSTYPLKDKTTIKVDGNVATTFDANNRQAIITRKLANGKEVTENKYDNAGKQTQQVVTTATTEQDSESKTVESTEKQTIQYKDGKPSLTTVQRQLKREGQTVNVQYSTPTGLLNDDSKITINGNTVNFKTLRELGITSDQITNQQAVINSYGTALAVSTALTEARNFGIDLSKAKPSYNAETGARTLTSEDRLKSVERRNDGSVDWVERVGGTNNIKSLKARTPDGAVTDTTCRDAAGCARDATGKIQGQYDTVAYNVNSKEVTGTSSRFRGKNGEFQDVEIGYTNPTDFRQNEYITKITIGIAPWNLDPPDKYGYQLITNQKDSRGRDIYYKNEEVFVRDQNGQYVRDNSDPTAKNFEELFKEAKVEDQKGKANDQRNQLNEAERKQASREKYQNFFQDFERVFTQFRGLRYFATLFIDDNELLKWRQDVDQAFSKLYLGTEYWTSAICEKDIEGQNEGVAYAETPQGLAQIGAHIEAARTQPIVNLSDGATSYIYKITFQVRNGDYENDLRAPENMTINALIKKEDGSSIKLFKKDIRVPRGSSFGKMGSSAIVKETKNVYTKICITFDRVPLKWKIKNNELCNAIQGAAGEPTTLNAQGQQQPRQGSDAELNDF